MSPATRILRLTTATAAAMACVTVTAGPAVADDSWPVPARAWITIKGHGYGHGHGMSQYGAEGAARQGLSHRQIVEFYYPGTTWGTAGGRISVQITADTTSDLVVIARPGLTVRDTAGGGRVELPDNGASRWRVVPTADGNRVSYLTDGWRPWRLLEGDGEFSAGAPITLVLPSGTRQYRGRLRAVTPSAGSADTVNVLRLENYLKGVVPLEIPALWSPQAVRAQAVAARTYAAYERQHRSGAICDTSSCQVYGGYSAEHPASNAAIRATRKAVLTSGGEPAFTQFSSSSGGWTSAGSAGYLTAKRDPYDGWSGNPNHSWSVRVTDTVIESRWPGIGNLTRLTVLGRDGNGEWGGRVRTLRIIGSAGRVDVSGDTFRYSMGLRSSWFTFSVARGRRALVSYRGSAPRGG